MVLRQCEEVCRRYVAAQMFGEDVGIYNALSAGIVVGLMIVPIIASLSEDAMRAVPRSLREGA